MRVCDLIIQFIVDSGIRDIFTVTGGGVMFMDDALACNRDMNVICCHHEQAAAMSAVAYAKYKGMGAALVTTGCGATNTITGVLNAWQDNTACIFIVGQCKLNELISSVEIPIRQFGVQEAATLPIISSITKYAEMITSPEDTLYHLEKAVYLARHGRPGPVWIEVPMGIQQAEVISSRMRHFCPDELSEDIKMSATQEEIDCLREALASAQRPIILAGQGVRLAGCTEELRDFVERNQIPVVTSRLGLDIMPTEHELYIGRVGNKGTRAGNFAIQNADLILVLGSRLSISTTGYRYEYFGREARIFIVDIDPNEHKKGTVRVDREINADMSDVFKKLSDFQKNTRQEWIQRCKDWKLTYPTCPQSRYEIAGGISMYAFMNELSACLKGDAVVVADAGSAVYVPAQAIRTTTSEQRYITSGGQAEMGFTLPATVGVSIARGKKETIGITGDGSFQMNIQELQTIVHHRLPVKLFVWNNDGYLSIRETQTRVFNGRYMGSDPASGVSFPSFRKIADAYGIEYVRIDTTDQLDDRIMKTLEHQGPTICGVMCVKDEPVLTAVTAKKLPDGTVISLPIEDMKPFLDRDEFRKNMIVKVIE